MKFVISVVLVLLAPNAGRAADFTEFDPELLRTVAINEPQLFVDDYLIENRYNESLLSAPVPHVRHRPERSVEPLITRDDDKPWEKDGLGYLAVAHDSDASLFRMYYQVVVPRELKGTPGYPPGTYCIGYAQSKDGLHWTKPLFDLISWGSIAKTNIVLHGKNEAHAPHIQVRPPTRPGRIRNIGTLPTRIFRGHRFLLYCGDHPHFLSTSDDGIHFSVQQQILPRRIDCHQTLVFDETRNEFVTFLRNKMIFGAPHGSPKRANHRMITRLSSPELWTAWRRLPTTVLLPDAGDGERFYAMPTFRYGGVYFGLLHHLQQEMMTVEVELVTSRDGFRWDRDPQRKKLIPVGHSTDWDRGMIYAADRVIENGDEWWLYYSGHSDYHVADGGGWGSVGLLRFRKEGFVSVRADKQGKKSFLVTRPFRWPGGDLVINADASAGHVAVRITTIRRDPVGEFSYENCAVFRGDSVRHRIGWKSADMRTLKGRLIRLEFRFVHADLFAFLASDRP